ncbi:Protein of unknown function [Bacillus wiedmannii]|nr:Protein of unknown function [Bacillus wiedmannii]
MWTKKSIAKEYKWRG